MNGTPRTQQDVQVSGSEAGNIVPIVPIESMMGSAESDDTPGAAETMGVGGLTGRLRYPLPPP